MGPPPERGGFAWEPPEWDPENKGAAVRVLGAAACAGPGSERVFAHLEAIAQ